MRFLLARLGILLAGGLVLAVPFSVTTFRTAPPAARFDTSPLPERSGEICFLLCGDTRRAMEPWRSNTDRMRREVIRKIVQLHPRFVLNCGDLVHKGWSENAWREFDRLTEPIRKAGIRYLPALGNHDYGSSARALENFFMRFPGLQGKRWYRYDVGWLRLLILDSNFDELEGLAVEQQEWLLENLKAAEADPRVRLVLLVAHHPPYTNSSHSPSLEVRRRFVRPARRFRKVRGMICGHVHSYERFEIEGWTFVVSGGGGAPLHKIKTDPEDWRTVPSFRGPEQIGHHVIECRLDGDGIQCTVHELLPGVEPFRWTVLDRFRIRAVE